MYPHSCQKHLKASNNIREPTKHSDSRLNLLPVNRQHARKDNRNTESQPLPRDLTPVCLEARGASLGILKRPSLRLLIPKATTMTSFSRARMSELLVRAEGTIGLRHGLHFHIPTAAEAARSSPKSDATSPQALFPASSPKAPQHHAGTGFPRTHLPRHGSRFRHGVHQRGISQPPLGPSGGHHTLTRSSPQRT